MKFHFEEGDLVQLQRVGEMDASDWCLDKAGHEQLINDSEGGAEYEIVCETMDGYYDIVNTSNGHKYAAVSDYHIIPTPETLRWLLGELGIE
jgi:hypothetical protein